jgi:hypothetical protein
MSFKPAPDRHSCLVFNDLKLKSVRLLKAFQCLWTGIIGENIMNVKRYLGRFEQNTENIENSSIFVIICNNIPHFNPYIYINIWDF